MENRDPRVDPKPGDQLTGFCDGPVTVLRVEGKWIWSDDGTCRIDVWRSVMKNAEVIHAAD